LQNKAAKIILDRLLYSSASYTLATEVDTIREKAFPAKMCACIQMSKWTLTLITQQHQHIITPDIKSILDSPALEGIGENKELPITLVMIVILSARYKYETLTVNIFKRQVFNFLI